MLVGVEMVVQMFGMNCPHSEPDSADTADTADTARNQRLRLHSKPTIHPQLQA